MSRASEARTRLRGGAGRLLAAGAAALLASAALRGARAFVGQARGPVAGGRTPRSGAAVALGAERQAHIAMVDVTVKEGTGELFLAESLKNAKKSVKEESNMRFDVLQEQGEPGKYMLVEMYSSADGPAGHKETEHYLSWREAVADLMEVPRSATQWDIVYPESTDKYEPDVLLLQRPEAQFLYISHVIATVKEGSEQEFIEATRKKIDDAVSREENLLRMDLLKSVDEPGKFLLIEVYRSDKSLKNHRRESIYARWRDTTAPLFGEPLVFKKYVNHFPNVPKAWKVDLR